MAPSQTPRDGVQGAHSQQGLSGGGAQLARLLVGLQLRQQLSICPIILLPFLLESAFLLALDSSTYISSPVFESSFLISCKS